MRPVTLLVALGVASAALVASAPSPRDAAAFEAKWNGVLARGAQRPSGIRTDFAADEVNAYLQLRLAPAFPTGVAEPSVTLGSQGRLTGRAIVDLDGLRKKSSGGWFDPAAYLSGKLPVTAVATLKTADGRGQLIIEAADVSGVPVPKSLLQELVTFYTRSADLPNGVNLDAPFDLPSGIQRIDVETGRATVVQ